MDWVALYRDAFTIKGGRLYWKESGPGRRADLLAESMSKRGYYVVRAGGKLHYVHRVIFAIIHGYLPVQVDHINGIKTDNSIGNLRGCCHVQNSRNRKTPIGASGVVGVTFCKQTGKWRAQACRGGKMRHIGRYDSIAEAEQARKEFEREEDGSFVSTL